MKSSTFFIGYLGVLFFLCFLQKALLFYFSVRFTIYVDLFLCIVGGRGQDEAFSMQIASWPSTAHWKDHPFLNALWFLLCRKPGVLLLAASFWAFCSVPWVCFSTLCQSHTVSIPGALQWVLLTASASPLAVLHMALATHGLLSAGFIIPPLKEEPPSSARSDDLSLLHSSSSSAPCPPWLGVH